jgi:hypothetical protein
MSDLPPCTPLASPLVTVVAAPVASFAADVARLASPLVAAGTSSEEQEPPQASLAPSLALAGQADTPSATPAIATVAAAAVRSNGSAPFALLAVAGPVSAKSPSSPSPMMVSPPQAQAQACRDGGERAEKQFSTPSRAPIAATPTALLTAATRQEQPLHLQHRHAAPRHAAA